MKSRLLTGLIAMLMIFTAFAGAQAQSPVKWNATVKMDNATEGTVMLTATIDAGWHIYGTKMPEDGPNPTKLYYAAKGVSFLGKVTVSKSPKREMDSMFGAELTYWEDGVTFIRKFKITDPASPSITITVNYMCCNDNMCRPPVSEKIEVKLK